MCSFGMVLLGIAACFYIGILYSHPLFLLIGDTLCLLFLLSFLELLLRLFTISCDLEIPIAAAEEQQPLRVSVTIKNRLPFLLRKSAVCVGIKKRTGTKERQQWLTLYDNAGKESAHVFELLPEGAGCYEIYIKRIRVYAFSGWFFLSKTSAASASFLVLPEIYAPAVKITEAVRNFLGDAEVFDDFRAGAAAEETFEIREYREKDKLQSIHWKRSAREEKLMVRERSLPKACAVVLLLEFKASKIRAQGKRKKMESAYLQTAAALSFALMQQQCPHFVAWYSCEKEKVRRIRVDDEESFYIFLECYLREQAYHDTELRQSYRESYKNECYLHDICINEQLEIYKDGEFIVKLEETEIADACEQLELLI